MEASIRLAPQLSKLSILTRLDFGLQNGLHSSRLPHAFNNVLRGGNLGDSGAGLGTRRRLRRSGGRGWKRDGLSINRHGQSGHSLAIRSCRKPRFAALRYTALYVRTILLSAVVLATTSHANAQFQIQDSHTPRHPLHRQRHRMGRTGS